MKYEEADAKHRAANRAIRNHIARRGLMPDAEYRATLRQLHAAADLANEIATDHCTLPKCPNQANGWLDSERACEECRHQYEMDHHDD